MWRASGPPNSVTPAARMRLLYPLPLCDPRLHRDRTAGPLPCSSRPAHRDCMPPLMESAATHAGASGPGVPTLDVVVPVHDEEADLEPCLRRLHAHLRTLPWSFRITVAENASTDRTVEVAHRVAAELPGIEVLALAAAGRGRALRAAWLRSDASVLVYMDVDLSTDLAALLPLVAPLLSRHS